MLNDAARGRPGGADAGLADLAVARDPAPPGWGDEEWRIALRPLNPRQRAVVVGRFVRGETQAALGARLGVCAQAVSDMEQRALRVMARTAALPGLD